jgi:prepilin-type processing-associated H-X9-DG protein
MNRQPDSIGVTMLKGCGCLVLVLVVVAVLYPIFYIPVCHAPGSSCQANMHQIAKALISYAGDYDDKFPCTRAPKAANGHEPEQGIEARGGAFAFQGTTWVEKIDPYVQKGSLVDTDGPGGMLPGRLGVMSGVFNCPEREKKWPRGVGQDIPDWHGYGYNFLYLGLPWDKDNKTETNPYRDWGFTAGMPRISDLKNASDTLLLVESRSIWAFPPFTNDGRALPANPTCISPRHNGRINVVFCDGHAKGIDPAELVTKGRMGKNRQLGQALDNRLWDPVKIKYPEVSP